MAILGVFLILCLLPAASAQSNTRLPNGKSRTMAIVKEDLKKSKRDIAEVIKLAVELQEEFEAGNEFVVDVPSVRKAEKIERLGRKIKNRLIRLQ